MVPLKITGVDHSEVQIYKICDGLHQGYSGTLEKILNDLYSSDWELTSIVRQEVTDTPMIELVFRRPY